MKTAIVVTEGKPNEFSFKLSTRQAPVGTVTFNVQNAGKVPHNFKVCASATKTGTATACVGKMTPMLSPGQSATLTVTFKTKGVFEYLCAVPGHAQAGMIGTISIGAKGTVVPLPTPAAPAMTTTTTAGPVTKPPATEALIGDPAAGSQPFAKNCSSCHTMAAAGASGRVGPNLDVAAPSQAKVVSQVTSGGGFMPSFGGQLSSQTINDLAAYVYASTHASP